MTGFAITRNNSPITEVQLKNAINTGINFGEYAGCISVYHEVAACKAAHYRYFDEWQDLDDEQRGFLVAHYLLNIVVQNHQQDAEITASEKK